MKYPWVSRLVIKSRLGMGATRCPICNKLLGSDGYDLHEFLFTRGDLMGLPWKDEIYHLYNCVGVCHEGCHTKATSKEGQIKCARSVIRRYFVGDIVDWIDDLPFKSPVMKNEAIHILKEAMTYG